jgi:hypothetical protein
MWKKARRDHSPAAHVRRPRLDCESHAVALDRNEVGAILVTSEFGAPLSMRWYRC